MKQKKDRLKDYIKSYLINHNDEFKELLLYKNLKKNSQSYKFLTNRLYVLRFILNPNFVDRILCDQFTEAYRIEDFENALCSDVNTAGALTVIYDVLKADVNDDTKKALIDSFDYVMGLNLAKAEEEEKPAADSELVSYIEEMIAKRKEAKKAKDFATADAIREELAAKGVAIKDTREGTVWEIV